MLWINDLNVKMSSTFQTLCMLFIECDHLSTVSTIGVSEF